MCGIQREADFLKIMTIYFKASISRLNNYKHAVVRIQFPDSMILQGVFTPNNTIEDVQNFVKEHLCETDKPFHICKYLFFYR